MFSKTLSFNKCAMSLAAIAVISACGGNNSPNVPVPEKRLTGRVVLGPVVGASCNVTNAAGNPISGVAPQTTGSSGVFSLVGIPDAQFPVIITCTGGSFYDEATNTTVASLAPIKAVSPTPGNSSDASTPSIGVTTLTSAAASVFLSLPPEQRNSNAAASANRQVAEALAPGLDILAPPSAISTSDQSLTNSPSDQYAAILAALSYLVKAAGGDPAQATANFINALARDIADGVIDGKVDGVAIPNAGYTSFASLVDGIESGTDSYEAANPNAAAATNEVQADEGNRGDATITPSPTGS